MQNNYGYDPSAHQQRNLTFTHALGLSRAIENTVGLNTEYRVTFSIDIKLEKGEILAVAGDIPILG